MASTIFLVIFFALFGFIVLYAASLIFAAVGGFFRSVLGGVGKLKKTIAPKKKPKGKTERLASIIYE